MYQVNLGEKILPILPENLKESVQIDNKKYDTFGGEMSLPGKAKLHYWTISSYIPFDSELSPTEFKNYIDGLVLRNYGEENTTPIEPIIFAVARVLEKEDGIEEIIFNTNKKVLIDSVEWEDRKGEPGDLYYTIKLVEYRKFGTKTV